MTTEHSSSSFASSQASRRLMRGDERDRSRQAAPTTFKVAQDPRWHEEFSVWATSHASFLRVGDLRRHVSEISSIVWQPEPVSASEFFNSNSPGIVGKQLFAILSPSLVQSAAVDQTTELRALLAVLNKERFGNKLASDDDLVCWPRFFVNRGKEEENRGGARAELYLLYTYFRVQTIILPASAAGFPSVFEHLETMAYLALATFCQRIVNASDDAVRAGLALARLVDLPNTLDGLEYGDDPATFDRIASTMGAVVEALKPVATDEEVPEAAHVVGHANLAGCNLFVMSHAWDAEFHMSPTGAKLQLVVDALNGRAKDTDVVFIDFLSLPQRLPEAGMPDLYEHSLQLALLISAEGTDGIEVALHLPLAQRTENEERRFRFAMSEMSRLYAYKACQVVVLPQYTEPTSFPGGSGTPLLTNGDSITFLNEMDVQVTYTHIVDVASRPPPLILRGVATGGAGQTDAVVLTGLEPFTGEEISVRSADGRASATFQNVCTWGRVSKDAYAERGWPTSEYSIARYHGRIVNTDDPAVQELERGGDTRWPSGDGPVAVAAYEELMSAKRADGKTWQVRFTQSGDREVVCFLFYRVCFGLGGAFAPDRWRPPAGAYEVPSEERLDAARRLRVGTGVGAPHKYYLAVHVQPPAMLLGSAPLAHAQLHERLAMGLLAGAHEPWRAKDKAPICLGDASKVAISRDLQGSGRIHCLVWSAAGFGWERRASDASLSLDSLCAELRKPAPSAAPKLVVVCMQFGARLAAFRLAAAREAGGPGVRAVLWMEPCLQSEELSGSLLLGVIGPILDVLHQPRMAGAPPERVVEALHALGQPIFGSRWRAGCVLRTTTGGGGGFPLLAWPSHSSLPAARSAATAAFQMRGAVEWLHDVRAPINRMALGETAEDGGLGLDVGATADRSHRLHEALKLIARVDGKPCDLLDRFGAAALLPWICQALTGSRRGGGGPAVEQQKGERRAAEGGKQGEDELVAALYVDEASGSEGGGFALQVRLAIRDIAFLHTLRDLVLRGVLDARLRERPIFLGDAAADNGATAAVRHGGGAEAAGVRVDDVRVDPTQFVEMYERSVLALDQLTPHQQQKLDECRSKGHAHLHIQAPAGAGKTFVAMHLALEVLRADVEASCLFVARNVALCYFIARWVTMRERNPLRQLQLLRRLHVLHEPFGGGVREVRLRSGRITIAPARSVPGYRLVIVDEAHHIYRDAEARTAVEARIDETVAQRILVSDVSQSVHTDIAYPPGLEPIELTEVVRCSRRIVTAATAFQIGGEKKLETSCHHDADGPPLKTYLFDVGQRPWHEEYVAQLLLALADVIQTFKGLNLEGRVAILVPDQAFLTNIKALLSTTLREAQFGDGGGRRRFELIDASEASARIMKGVHARVGSEGEGRIEALVLDTVSNFDGLERLIVVATGLDVKIGEARNSAEGDGGDDLETRSRLYRALTRAHMMAIVVNEMLPGGWLEHLLRVRFHDKDQFDREAELRRLDREAAQKLVEEPKRWIRQAVSKRANALKGRPLVVQLLAKRVEARVPKDAEAVTEAAVEELTQEAEAVLSADIRGLEAAAVVTSSHRAPLTNEEEFLLLERLDKRRLGGGEVSADAVMLEYVQQEAVQTALEKLAADLTSEERLKLAERVLSAVQHTGATDLEGAVKAEATAWRALKQEIDHAITTLLGERNDFQGLKLSEDVLETLKARAVEMATSDTAHTPEASACFVLDTHALRLHVRQEIRRAAMQRLQMLDEAELERLIADAITKLEQLTPDPRDRSGVTAVVASVLGKKAKADHKAAGKAALTAALADAYIEVSMSVRAKLEEQMLARVKEATPMEVANALVEEHHDLISRVAEGLRGQPLPEDANVADLQEAAVAAVYRGDNLDDAIARCIKELSSSLIPQTVWETAANSTMTDTPTGQLAFDPYRLPKDATAMSSEADFDGGAAEADLDREDLESVDSDYDYDESAFTSLGEELLAGQLKLAKVYGQEEPPAAEDELAWEVRYFVLYNSGLFVHYDEMADGHPVGDRGLIDLSTIRTVEKVVGVPTFVMKGASKVYLFKLEPHDEVMLRAWIAAISQELAH